jgi:hypothetical protein
MNQNKVAACGLICEQCSIYRIPFDQTAAQEMRQWFIKNGWIEDTVSLEEFISQGPYCTGCHGSLETHWSPDCTIRHCCIEEKDLINCSHCTEFPCDKLQSWAQTDEAYSEAIDRLEKMKRETN